MIGKSIILLLGTLVSFGTAYAASPQEYIDKGKELYMSYGCAVCHGKDGDGKGISSGKFYPPPTNFHDPKKYQQGTDIESMRNAIKNGIKDENSMMPAFDHFSKQELDQLTAFLQSLQKQ